MPGICRSAAAYEAWLRKQLRGDVVEADLECKHAKMGASPFVFLRATYWRWAETILEVCPDLASAPAVLAVGDIHIENYGTWRDVDGRVVWGVNDFDEAAEMPYALDLVRLATSALLASEAPSNARIVTAAILKGYGEGLKQPRAIVLEKEWQWLRELVVVDERARAKFWKKMEAAKTVRAPPRYRKALAAAMPEPGLACRTARRRAGAGSLGRPRWVAMAEWRGGPVVREAKALLPSAWLLPAGRGGAKLRCHDLATGKYRAVDPWYGMADAIVVRRLSPNNRKIEAIKQPDELLSPQMLEAMGLELAGVHLGVSDAAAIARDLKARKRGWLLAAAKAAASATERDFKDWGASGR